MKTKKEKKVLSIQKIRITKLDDMQRVIGGRLIPNPIISKENCPDELKRYTSELCRDLFEERPTKTIPIGPGDNNR